MAVDAPAAEARPSHRSDKPVVAYNSKAKLIALATPCLLVAGICLYAAAGGLPEVEGGLASQLAIAAVGGLAGLVLLRMAFDRRPVLVIDETGVTCTRPEVGTIPWRAVAGIGITKSVMLRKVLLLAVEESELDEQAKRHVGHKSGFMSMFSPQVAKFHGQVAGRPTVSIPIAYLRPSVRELSRLIDEKIQYHG